MTELQKEIESTELEYRKACEELAEREMIVNRQLVICRKANKLLEAVERHQNSAHLRKDKLKDRLRALYEKESK